MGDVIVKHLYRMILCSLFWFVIQHNIFIATCSSSHPANVFGCDVSMDTKYGGFFANCSNKNLSFEDLSQLQFKNNNEITTLILNSNDIRVLENNSLSRMVNLRRLECVLCNLNKIQIDALFGLMDLEILILNENNLKIIEHSFPKGCFKHVPNLKKLFIESNWNYGFSDNYSAYLDIFEFLPKLTDLSLDSFYNLRIGSEFCKFRNLTNLRVYTQHIQSFLNDSFLGFQCSSIKGLDLKRGTIRDHKNVGLDAFQFLPNISSLTISVHVGNRNLLAMMKHLQGRRFDKIHFIEVQLSIQNSSLEEVTQDAIITKSAMKYLSSICVSEFIWGQSYIFSFDTDSILSSTWSRCLQTLGLNMERLMKQIGFSTFSELKKLEIMQVSTASSEILTYGFWNGGRAVDASPPRRYKVKNENDLRSVHLGMGGGNFHMDRLLFDSDKSIGFATYIDAPDQLPQQAQQEKQQQQQQQQQRRRRGRRQEQLSMQQFHQQHQNFEIIVDKMNYTVSLPPLQQTMELIGIHSVGINDVFIFRNNCLVTLSIANCYRGPGLTLTGKMLGLNKLKTINFQDSKVTIALDFFDWFPNLNKIILRNTQQQYSTSSSKRYLDTDSERLFLNVFNLEYLDLAQNGLRTFPPNNFQNLKFLCLSSNHFYSIPIDFHLSPALEVLDLRSNLFNDLTAKDMQAIDDHIRRVGKFVILFSDNQLSCSCSSLPFLAWLDHHRDHFDQGGNYSCMSQDGHLVYTADYNDAAAFWRQCQGRHYLMVSLTLLFILASVFLATFLGMKNRIQITSRFRQLVLPGFRLKTRKDFQFDVCIGYADQDVLYVRSVLLRYLEDQWHLRTFVHNRDLRQDPLLMSEAIGNSWRCLLLITEDFLLRCNMAHNIMKVASFFVSPLHPDSLVVIVEENMLHQIPDYVLQVVDEDNIIVLPRLDGLLQYEDKETLRTRLLL